MVVRFLDLDGFEAVDDTFGHDIGDVVLCEVGARLSSALRPGDVVGRYGGDEFVVRCRDVEPEKGGALVARLSGAMRGIVTFPGGSWPIAVSIGATRFEPGDDVGSVLRRADQAMFDKKRLLRSTRAMTDSGRAVVTS